MRLQGWARQKTTYNGNYPEFLLKAVILTHRAAWYGHRYNVGYGEHFSQLSKCLR
jgi:hypothetical protein